MKHQVTVTIDTDGLRNYTDTHLASLWHVAQANPAPIEDRDAGELAEKIGREIIARFLSNTRAELYAHQGEHHYWTALTEHCRLIGDKWVKREEAGEAPAIGEGQTNGSSCSSRKGYD